MLRRLKSLGTPVDELKEVYTSFILPKLIYASPAWSPSLNITQHHQLEKIQKRAFRLILGPAYTDYESVLNTLNLLRLSIKHEEINEIGGWPFKTPSTPQITPPLMSLPPSVLLDTARVNPCQSPEGRPLQEHCDSLYCSLFKL